MLDHAQYFLEDLEVGMTATFEKIVSEQDVIAFADVSGDNNPLHLDADYAAGTMFGERIAHGMLTAGLVSAVIATQLPGNGTVYLSQSLKFKAPVLLGQSVAAIVEVTDIHATRRRVTLACKCIVGEKAVLEGEAVVMVPSRDQAA
ncbi:MAG: MaoC family dehydratase [Aestuariivirgaceae bacterium]